MKMDTVFLVKQEAVKRLVKMNKRDKMGYILGICEDDSFSEYLIDMNDYEGTPNQFYDTLISNCESLKPINNLQIYEDKHYFIYCVYSPKTSQLLDELLEINYKKMINQIVGQCHCEQKSDELSNQYKSLLELVSNASINDSDLLFILLKE